MASKRYAKEFPFADRRRWYIELVLHGKSEWDAEYAEREYLFYSEQELLDYHELAGCYLKVLREESAYDRSIQGKVDHLRDDIVELQNWLRELRKWYNEAKIAERKESMEFYVEQGEIAKQDIKDKEREIVKLLTGGR